MKQSSAESSDKLSTRQRSEYSQADKTIDRLEWFLDKSIPLPGGFRVGMDGIIGLIPGVGDLLSSGISLYLIQLAMKKNLPKAVIYRMYGNVLIDTVLGAIPFFGDLFDFGFKANVKNVALYKKYSQSQTAEKQAKKEYFKIALVVLALALVTVVIIIGTLKLAAGLIKFIFD